MQKLKLIITIIIRIAFGIDFLFFGWLWYLAPGLEKIGMTVPLIILIGLAVTAYQLSHWYVPEHTTETKKHMVTVTQAIVNPNQEEEHRHGRK